jgi:methionine aminotransferase
VYAADFSRLAERVEITRMIESKFPNIGTTIFTTMSALAAEVGAVNLGQGFPDFGCDPRLPALVSDAMRAGHNQYPQMAGVPALREALALKVGSMYGKRYDPVTEITITAGATQAIHTTLAAIVRTGDEVIIFEPVFDSYEPGIRMHGGVPVYARLRFPDYRPDWQQLRSLITPRTRAVMINTPHNPTATCWQQEDFAQLAAILRGTDIVVISDEVYEHMVYDGLPHLSIARHAELAERAFVISSFGKTYHVTGWKIGYCMAPAPLMAEFRKAHQFVVFTVNSPAQYGIAAYMGFDTHIDLPAFYQAKRDVFLSAVASSRLRWLPCRGTYFVSAQYGHLPEYAHLGEAEFAVWLTKHIGVACIPTSAFFHDQHDDRVVRFCFAKKEETLMMAAQRLNTI